MSTETKKLNSNSKRVVKQIMIPLIKKLDRGITTNGTVEIFDATLKFNPRISELTYGDLRPFNKKYAENEENWYNSLDRCIKGHPGIENNTTWSKIATDDGIVNSNYGYLVFAKRTNGKSQYEYALESLKNSYNGNDSGRQSVIYYAGPDMQWMWNDGVNAKHDFTCTFQTHHFIRDNKLFYIVYQRSADLIFGTTYDFHHHCNVYKKLFKDLRKSGIPLKTGKIIMHFSSLHVYERHFKLIRDIVNQYQQKRIKTAEKKNG